jgi:hypothetical protein
MAAAVFAVSIALPSHSAFADEGGVSFWVPGLFGSLAAVPQVPGWSLATVGYHTSVSAGGDVASEPADSEPAGRTRPKGACEAEQL